MSNQAEHWSSPVYNGIADPRLSLAAGVPPGFLVLVFLGSVLGGLVMTWRIPVFGIAVYGIGKALTAWDAKWWPKLKAYRRYKTHYEG